jgi:hypothetical protein
MKNTNQELTLANDNMGVAAPVRPAPSPLVILQSAIDQGITSESIGVVERLAAMCREQRADDARVAFNRAFFQLRKEMPVLYADKEVRTKSGALAFQYVSPDEIKNMLDPLMARHGFTTMAGQTMANGEATVTVSLIHEGGHSESRSFTVRVSPGNQLMSPTQCDAAASSSAERHCLMKLFGLRTRLNESDDARNLGDVTTKITSDEAAELESRLANVGKPAKQFLDWVGYSTFSEIPAACLTMCRKTLERYERAT